MSLQLPPGPKSDNYYVYLYVLIRDNADGFSYYNLTKPVQVNPDEELFDSLLTQLGTNDKDSIFLNKLSNGNLQESAKGMISMMEIVNRKEIQAKSNLTSDNSTVNI